MARECLPSFEPSAWFQQIVPQAWLEAQGLERRQQQQQNQNQWQPHCAAGLSSPVSATRMEKRASVFLPEHAVEQAQSFLSMDM